MRVLCVCEGGNVRSHQLAFWFKSIGHDALAVGTVWNTPETIDMLAEWAELITVAEERLTEAIPVVHRAKVSTAYVVGADRWGVPIVPELATIYKEAIKTQAVPVGPRLLA